MLQCDIPNVMWFVPSFTIEFAQRPECHCLTSLAWWHQLYVMLSCWEGHTSCHHPIPPTPKDLLPILFQHDNITWQPFVKTNRPYCALGRRAHQSYCLIFTDVKSKRQANIDSFLFFWYFPSQNIYPSQVIKGIHKIKRTLWNNSPLGLLSDSDLNILLSYWSN